MTKILKSEIAPNGDGSYSPLAIEIMGKIDKFTQELLEEYSDRLSPHSIHYLLMTSCDMPVTFFLIDEISNEVKPCTPPPNQELSHGQRSSTKTT